MNISDLVNAVLAEVQGPVSKELVKGTNKFRTVVKGNSPIKKAILSSEHQMADLDLAQRPKGIGVIPGRQPGYFRAPGMMQRTEELADAVKQIPEDRRSLTERALLKSHGYLGDTEGQRAMLPLLDRLAAQNMADNKSVLSSYWAGEVGDELDQARARKMFVMHGTSPGGPTMDSTSFLDRLARENDLARNDPRKLGKMVRPDGYYDVQPANRAEFKTGDINTGRDVADVRYGEAVFGDPARGLPNPYQPEQTRIPTPFQDRPLGRGALTPDGDMTNLVDVDPQVTPVNGTQRYGFAKGLSIPGMDNPGNVTHLPPPQHQPNWRSPDEMATRRSEFVRNLKWPGGELPEWLTPPETGAISASLNGSQAAATSPLPKFDPLNPFPPGDEVNKLTFKMIQTPKRKPEVTPVPPPQPFGVGAEAMGKMRYDLGKDYVLKSMPEDDTDRLTTEIKRLMEMLNAKKNGGR